MIIFLKIIGLALLMLPVFIVLSILAILIGAGLFRICLGIFELIEMIIYGRK